MENGKITASVRPTLVSRDCILSDVNGVFNAIMIHGDQTGDVMFYGKGAGKEATASAVVADIIDCVKHIGARKYLFWEDGAKDYVDNQSDETVRLYVRAVSDNFEELVSQFNDLFPGVSCVKNKFRGELAFITDEDRESAIRGKISQFKNVSHIRVLHTLFR